MDQSEGFPSLVVEPDWLSSALKDRIDLGEELQSRKIAVPRDLKALHDESVSWSEYNKALLLRSFTSSGIAANYEGVPAPLLAADRSLREEWQELVDDIGEQVRRLRSILSQIPLFERSEQVYDSRPVGPRADAQGVFIVHGRNEAVKHSVARFVQQVTGRDPIILHEQVNAGRTVIEKFEQHAEDIGFAIILLTGDDEGQLRGSNSLRPRARQNVIFEHGFFFGRLGRGRVGALHESDVELPSDLGGVLYTNLDAGWKLDLGREMQAAGIVLDLNKAR